MNHIGGVHRQGMCRERVRRCGFEQRVNVSHVLGRESIRGYLRGEAIRRVCVKTRLYLDLGDVEFRQDRRWR